MSNITKITTTEYPVKLEELCQFSFSFTNLIKIIEYLNQKNILLEGEIKDLDKRVNKMEFLKNDIDDLKVKSKNIEKTNEELNRSFSNLSENVLKFDSRITKVEAKANDLDSRFKKFEIIQNDHEKNLNHLNKVVEDNIKTTNQLNTMMNLSNKTLSELSQRVKENYDNINKDITESKMNNDKEHKDINTKIDEINEYLKKLEESFEKKNTDINNQILNIINDVANINGSGLGYGDPSQYGKEININLANINKDSGNSNLFKVIMDQIEEQNEKFKKFKEEEYEPAKENQKSDNDYFRGNIEDLKEQIKKLKNTIEENNENLENNYLNFVNQNEEKLKPPENDSENKTEKRSIQYIGPNLSDYVPYNVFKKLSDNVRILTSTMNAKPWHEEIENVFKKLNKRLETVEMDTQGQTHGPKTRINLNLVNSSYANDPSNPENFSGQNEFDILTKRLEERIMEQIGDLIKNKIINIDLTLNPKINELIDNYNKMCEDIEKNNKSIIEIRNLLLSNNEMNDISKLQNQVNELEEECKSNKLGIIELTKIIEGNPDDEEEEDSENNLTGSIKERINFLNKTIQSLNLKIAELENKNKSMTKEVKDDIKQYLKYETQKIMQQFKLRLESFTSKFEYELKNKIDQIGLSNFEHKINNKLHYDLKEKLDKNELKKNNNIIKKKIDSLENRISKTLVDTIIDLQMDDQPLIIKKNANGVDVCASCNQPVSITKSTYTESSFVNNTSMNRIKNLNKSVINFNQPLGNKSNNNSNSDRNLTLGQSKLPDIIPNIHPK